MYGGDLVVLAVIREALDLILAGCASLFWSENQERDLRLRQSEAVHVNSASCVTAWLRNEYGSCQEPRFTAGDDQKEPDCWRGNALVDMFVVQLFSCVRASISRYPARTEEYRKWKFGRDPVLPEMLEESWNRMSKTLPKKS